MAQMQYITQEFDHTDELAIRNWVETHAYDYPSYKGLEGIVSSICAWHAGQIRGTSGDAIVWAHTSSNCVVVSIHKSVH